LRILYAGAVRDWDINDIVLPDMGVNINSVHR
jgi:hypothetical protein